MVLMLAVSTTGPGQASECRGADHSFAAHAGHAGNDEACAQTTAAHSSLSADPIAVWPGLLLCTSRDLKFPSAESHQTITSADPN